MDECGKAVFYTKAVAKKISHELIADPRGIPQGLDVALLRLPEQLRPEQLGAIGFMGATRPGAWQKEGVFSLYLGGSLEGRGTLARWPRRV